MTAILTPSGYRAAADLSVGDAVTAFDMVTGEMIVNEIESIDLIDEQAFEDRQNARYRINGTTRFGAHNVLLANGRVVRVDRLAVGDKIVLSAIAQEAVETIARLDDVPPFAFFRINGAWSLNSEQSIWRNGIEVCHARDLVVGDTIYDGDDNPVVVSSIEPVSQDGWFRFAISGDHSYIADGLSLHNASRFWVGGTGTWDASSTTHWSATSGGASGASVPGSSDAVTFDASSGGGTVTVNTTVNVISITMGAFTGTLDFSANNNDVTLQTFSGTGTGTRTLNMGNGTWTMTDTGSLWNNLVVTNFTFNANSSNLTFTANSASTRTFTGGAVTYGTITVSGNASGGVFFINGATTIATFNVSGPNFVAFPTTTTTISTLSANGSSGAEIGLASSSTASVATLSIASNAPSISWAGIRCLTCTGGATFVASNSLDLGLNSGITITPPSGGGGGGLLSNPGMSGGMVA